MIEGLLLFFVGIGALLVSIVSILRVAWLAVLIPLLIAIGAGYGLVVLNDRTSSRPSRPDRPTEAHSEKSRPEKSGRMAA